MALVGDWLNDPQASASLAIALIAGTWAVAQFRPLARERRRETYEAMANHYADLRGARGAAVPAFPPLIVAGQIQVLTATGRDIDSSDYAAVERCDRVASETREWQRDGLAFTAAHEILRSEAKFRAMLYAVEEIRRWRTDSSIEIEGRQYSLEVLEAAETLAHDVNVFLFHYENGNYPARQTLGLLHRSLAVVSKVIEPVVWERSVSADARWGRRALRIGLAAQHFNDVTPIHCTSDLSWASAGGSHLIHPRLKREIPGTTVLTDSPSRPRLLPALRIWLRSCYWYCIGLMSPVPRLWPLSYGGRRLRSHRRSENRLTDLLGAALELECSEAERPALDLGWDLRSLQAQQRRRMRKQRRELGRIAWLWFPRSSRGS